LGKILVLPFLQFSSSLLITSRKETKLFHPGKVYAQFSPLVLNFKKPKYFSTQIQLAVFFIRATKFLALLKCKVLKILFLTKCNIFKIYVQKLLHSVAKQTLHNIVDILYAVESKFLTNLLKKNKIIVSARTKLTE
jgi:hypothetical protein